jgi:hypothetical protein
MSDTAFLKSVPIGSVFEMEAQVLRTSIPDNQVAYCEDGLATVVVDAFVAAARETGGPQIAHKTRQRTSSLNFVFRVPTTAPRVFPTSYEVFTARPI